MMNNAKNAKRLLRDCRETPESLRHLRVRDP